MPIKQITVNGQAIELYSLDGRIWCSRIADVIAMRKRKAELERHIKTTSRNIYAGRVNDRVGADSENYFQIHIPIKQ